VFTYTTKVLIPLKLVLKRVLVFYRLPVLDFNAVKIVTNCVRSYL
jgi:hypothetical protein